MRRARGGFTLMELLVGLAVGSLALMAGFAALSFVDERGEAAETAMLASLEGATARDLLVDWLTSARLNAQNLGGSFDGANGEDQGKKSDELTFPTTAATPLQAPTSLVHLYVDEDSETPETGLVAELKARAQDEPRRVELLPQVATLEIRYLPDPSYSLSAQPGGGGQAHVDVSTDWHEWQDSWQGQNRLPRAVELVLEPVPGDSLPLLLRYPIRVRMGTVR